MDGAGEGLGAAWGSRPPSPRVECRTEEGAEGWLERGNYLEGREESPGGGWGGRPGGFGNLGLIFGRVHVTFSSRMRESGGRVRGSVFGRSQVSWSCGACRIRGMVIIVTVDIVGGGGGVAVWDWSQVVFHGTRGVGAAVTGMGY